ncbi:MAG TPA: trypsin-like peptidase domain-containing protein [Candidatus Anammoximicrobium sp.]|nr:trypsin-like peptidase domain-containing protein [Candidatus Anammoximicrobium sp.]
MKVRRPLGPRLCRAVLLLLASYLTSQAGEQTPPAESLEALPVSAEARQQLYQEVDRDVAALERQGSLLKRVVRLVTPTVVHIEAERSSREDIRFSRRSVEEAGSGVVIEHTGGFYILTNRHVINDSLLAQIKIKLADGRVLHPKQVWTDRGTDVAIMEVTAPDLVPARLGDSDKLEIGDFVLAVGSPFGLSHSVTYGIISAKGRRDLKLGDGSVKYQNFLQTDAAINPGNSGGPLLNLRGEVIGINTAIASSSGGSEGIGFSIPINMVMKIATQLIERGNVARAYLGVQLDSRFDAARASALGLPRRAGALVSNVTPNSPAAASDLREGDVILKVNEVTVEDDAHLVNLVSLSGVGESINLVLYRAGKTLAVKVKVAKREDFEPE